MTDTAPLPSAFPIIHAEFEGRTLSVVSYQGRPAWIAREVGAAIGYARGGKRLVSEITREWADEFIEGHDFVLVDGEDLAALKALPGLGPDSVPSRAPGLLLLFEPGLHLVLTRTNKPIGKRLRRFLVDEVMPCLARLDHAALGARTLALVVTPVPDRMLLRELRLACRVDLDDRRFRHGALRQVLAVLRALGRLDDDALARWETYAAEIALARPLQDLLGVPPRWCSPTEIAARLGVSPQRVGRAVTQLGLRADLPGLARSVEQPVPGLDRLAVCWLYSPEAVRRVEAALTAQGFVAPAGA